MPPHAHDHHHHRPVAAEPTVSLLRLSAAQRLVGVSLALATLWLMVGAIVA